MILVGDLWSFFSPDQSTSFTQEGKNHLMRMVDEHNQMLFLFLLKEVNNFYAL